MDCRTFFALPTWLLPYRNLSYSYLRCMQCQCKTGKTSNTVSLSLLPEKNRCISQFSSTKVKIISNVYGQAEIVSAPPTFASTSSQNPPATLKSAERCTAGAAD